MTEGSYKQFCPVAMASEVLCNRWTMIIIRELICGSTRFNDLKRGVPRMSPALLSKRLKDLETMGIVRRVETARGGNYEYLLTRSGRELEPIVRAFGVWGQRWIEANPTLQNLDPELLMWDMRRNIDIAALPRRRRSVIQFSYSDLPPKRRNYWLIVEANGTLDVCAIDPGFDVDLFITTDLKTMTAIYLGLDRIHSAIEGGALIAIGDRELETTLPSWIGLSSFATEQKLADLPAAG